MWFFVFFVRRGPVSDAIRKPRNARSKRALEAREAKEVEDARTAIFVRGTHAGEVVQNAMKELVRRLFVGRSVCSTVRRAGGA